MGCGQTLGQGVEALTLVAAEGLGLPVAGPRRELQEQTVGTGVEVLADGLVAGGDAVGQQVDDGKPSRWAWSRMAFSAFEMKAPVSTAPARAARMQRFW